MTQRCGYIALVGRPNAGKSTLLNALLGQKIAMVSSKPQTTRNRILGVYTEADGQAIFLDTPGMHRSGALPKLNRIMNKVAWNVLNDADIVCYLVDSAKGWNDEDTSYFKGIIERFDKKILVIASKIDSAKKDVIEIGTEAIRSGLKQLHASCQSDKEAEKIHACEFIEVSAKRPESVSRLRNAILHLLPEAPWLFEADDVTDLPQQFICGEIVREQVFRQLSEELPYSCGVKIDEFKFEKNITVIRATIVVQKESHKGMVIGKGGSRLRSIGSAARLALEKHLGRRVFLELFVKVQEGWIDSPSLIAEFAGVEDPEV